MRITLKKKNEEIVVMSPKDGNEATQIIFEWLRQIDFLESVVVVFQNWKVEGTGDALRNQQHSILVSQSWDDIIEIVDNYIEHIFSDELDLVLFAYGSYKEAFSFCIDLKEGF